MRKQPVKSDKFKRFGVAMGLLVGSYLTAGFVNASPITHQRFESVSRTRVIVVAPQADSVEMPASGAEEPALELRPIQSL